MYRFKREKVERLLWNKNNMDEQRDRERIIYERLNFLSYMSSKTFRIQFQQGNTRLDYNNDSNGRKPREKGHSNHQLKSSQPAQDLWRDM